MNKHDNRWMEKTTKQIILLVSSDTTYNIIRLTNTRIQNSRSNQDGLIINAGGYTHTSVAIHDALKILKIPIIELHISNIYNREEFRHKSLISTVAKGVICGFGANGYIMSLNAMNMFLKKWKLIKN